MKRKTKKLLLNLFVASALVIGSAAVVMAEAATEETAAEVVEAVTEETEGELIPEDVKLTVDGIEIVITNTTEVVFTTAVYEKAEETTVDGSTEETWNLILTEKEGTVHTFEAAEPLKWNEASLVEEFEIFYITYKDEAGTSQEYFETVEEITFEEPIAVYATTGANVRKAAGMDGEIQKVTVLGEEYELIGGAPGWLKVKQGELEGYVHHKYITADKTVVDELVKEAQAAAQAAAEAAARAAAQKQAQQQVQQPAPQQPVAPQPAPQQPVAPQPEVQEPVVPETTPEPQPEPQPEPVYEVSRVKYDYCDGTGHGYYEITYSDGTVVFEEY